MNYIFIKINETIFEVIRLHYIGERKMRKILKNAFYVGLIGLYYWVAILIANQPTGVPIGALMFLGMTGFLTIAAGAVVHGWLNPQLNPEQVLAQRMENRRQRLEKENNERINRGN